MSNFKQRISRVVCLALWLALAASARGEAMLELFQMSWSDLSQKMPELAEAGYTSLWLPPPAKGSSVFSVGYDVCDAFDLGDQYQRGTTATKYGTKAELLKMVETAHRFGIRVYFDNIMNHRAFDTPGYDANTPTNIYPGLVPQDFHLQTTSSGNRNWPNVQDWNNQWDVQYEPLSGLLDLATEPGMINGNFGPTLGSTITKPSFIRQPGRPDYYMDTNSAWLGGPWHGFNGTNGQPVSELVTDYLTRAAMWTLFTTKCDGFRLDAIKHVPSGFFGDSSSSWNGYLGGIQAMFDYAHGYGTNVTGNGYLEGDDNRNSCFDTEAPRNDALLFGEHLGAPPSYGEYITRGMRLLNVPLRTTFNGALQGGGSLPSGLDQRDFIPASGAFSSAQGVQFAEDQDHILCCPTHREIQNAYYFMHEGLPMIYSDNFNWAGDPSSSGTFPQVPMTDYLGQYGDNAMPEIAWLHHQLARGGTRSRWSDAHIVAFERYDYRDPVAGDAYTNADATVMLFALNATFNSAQGDVLFDDGIARTADGYYSCYNGSPSRGCGLLVSFPPGSVLSQMATTSPGGGNLRTCPKLLVHRATTDYSQAVASASAANPIDRLIYVNTAPPPGGGALELLVPAGGWVMYGYQWPEPSRVNDLTNAISFRQAGALAPTVTVLRHDGANGDPNFSPAYPFKLRGSIDASGNVLLAPGEGHVASPSNSYAIQIPVLTNAPFDLAVRCDASATNALLKLDGGLDLNSQMGFPPTTGFDLRDNRPGYVSDVYLGFEQTAPQLRYGPEKFAARLVSRNNLTSLGAETYYYTVGGSNTAVNGSGNGNGLNGQTANWVYHDAGAPVTVLTNASVPTAPASQMNPTNPAPGQAVEIWVKTWYQVRPDTGYLCFLYYTTDSTNPEGAFGQPRPGTTTKVVQGAWMNHDLADATIDWWKITVPAAVQAGGAQVRYKVAFFSPQISTISDADASKDYGLSQFGVTNFNPVTGRVWLHNDLNTNNTAVGLLTGFHIVRARCFLPRSGKSAVYNTFAQTFYYDGQLPGGVVAYPASNGSTITASSYQVVVRADSAVTSVDFNIQDADPSNDDVATDLANGNGLSNGVPIFAAATAAAPDASLSAQYPNYPQEFRFNYVSVPSSGSATITVRLKTLATSAYPDRLTTLTRTLNTAAPVNLVQIGYPQFDGQVVTNDTFLIQTCFTPTLTTNNANLFSVYINGELQARSNYFFRPPGSVAGCPNLRSLFCPMSYPASGTNLIQVVFTNGFTLGDTRFVAVARQSNPTDSDGDGVPNWTEILAGTNPYDSNSVFKLTGVSPVTWLSVSNRNYQVLATTNLLYPFAPVSQVIPAASSNASWPDPAPDPTNTFYRVLLK